jgi:hypothetical protein
VIIFLWACHVNVLVSHHRLVHDLSLLIVHWHPIGLVLLRVVSPILGPVLPIHRVIVVLLIAKVKHPITVTIRRGSLILLVVVSSCTSILMEILVLLLLLLSIVIILLVLLLS